MSKPAQRPPKNAPHPVLVVDAGTEVVLLALSFMVGIAVLMVLMGLGVLPDAATATWSGIVAGPVLIGTAGLSYLGIERLLARVHEPVLPLVLPSDRKGVGLCVLIALGGVVVALLGSGVISLVQQELLSTEVEEQQAIVELVRQRDLFQIVMLAISAVVLAPLTEELLFRHMFFRRLLHRSGPVLAWTLPPLAFALAHWNLVGVLVYVWLGLVFAYSYLLSGRLWVAIAVHAGHNAFALSMLLWAPDALPDLPEGLFGF